LQLSSSLILDRRPPHIAAVSRAVEWSRAMERAAIVPDDQIADPPAMLVNEARLGRECGQLVKKGATLLGRPSDDVRRMRSEKERASPGAGMNPHHGLANRRQCGALFVGELRVANKAECSAKSGAILSLVFSSSAS
jgi:hypothetical protein